MSDSPFGDSRTEQQLPYKVNLRRTKAAIKKEQEKIEENKRVRLAERGIDPTKRKVRIIKRA